MNLTLDQLQLIRLMCDLSIDRLPSPEREQAIQLVADVEDFLFNKIRDDYMTGYACSRSNEPNAFGSAS